MRAFVAGLALAFLLSMTPSIALADDGDTNDVTADMPDGNDPGITALHDAIDNMHDARTALRTECPNNSEAKCRAASKAVRDVFKDAREQAIAAHHAFREEQKTARDSAKEKAKAALKDKAAAKAKDRAAKPSEAPKSPRPSETPKTPSPSATPRG